MVNKSILAVIIFHIILELLGNSINATPLNSETSSALNVVVIGAGPSGLVSAKYAIEQGFNVTVYEQGEELGGQWVYTDQIGKDKYGNDIHSSVYKGLTTTVPIQCMELREHHYPNNTHSYAGPKDVLLYLQSYADRFDLQKHIKFNHLVIRVHPIENGKWEVIVKDLPNNKFETIIYDAVFVCNGHYTLPFLPTIEGANQFEGKMIHSHVFRTVDGFRGENVLVIGGGVSGISIAARIAKVANQVTLSVNTPLNQLRSGVKNLLEMVTLKSSVERFTANAAEFIDGTHQNFTMVIYATGFNYSYPFLSVDSGIHVDDSFVQPLYKHIFNINHPTMAFVGVPKVPLSIPSVDIEARFAMKFISGASAKKLPSKFDMLDEMWRQNKIHLNKGNPVRYSHILFGNDELEYYKQLSEMANIENIPEVLMKIYWDGKNEWKLDPLGSKKNKYTILDDSNFKKEKFDEIDLEI